MTKNPSSKVAKNTLYLYIRMFFTMGVALYTSRVALKVLGIEDYGIYSIVGGIVTMFSFFNSAMSNATQRFFSFEIGRKDVEKLQKTFSASVNIHAFIALIILLLAETLGLWFVNNHLNYPIEKTTIVNWVYQFSILAFITGIIKVPYNALIIAHERMVAYAYLTIIEVVLKLLIVFLLLYVNIEKLTLYSILVFVVSLVITLAYKIYCNKHFQESTYIFYYEKKLYRSLTSYSGWSLFGNIAAVSKGQGVNIILNTFFGPMINAAYGIGLQVHSATNLLVTNFQLAVNPQIIKKYAENDIKSMLILISKSSRFSFYLMLLIALPILFEVDIILQYWLKNTPPKTSSFVFLIIINLLIDSLSGPLMTGTQATGKIKYYQIVVGTIVFLNLPISYFALWKYKLPEVVYYVSIALSVIAFSFRLFFINYLIKFPTQTYLKNVVFIIIPVIIISIIPPYLIHNNLPEGITRLFLVSVISSITIALSVYTIGLESDERKFINQKIKKAFRL